MQNRFPLIPSIVTKKVDLSYLRKLLINFIVVIIVCDLFYLIISTRTSILTVNSIVTSVISSSGFTFPQCRLSMNESDNWFCESDTDWKRRKMLHHRQNKRNRISDARPLFFQNNWEPTIQCAFEQRLGNTGDGGKWICDIHRFGNMKDTNILIYSLGSSGEFSFEQALRQKFLNAEIHTFDMNLFVCPRTVCVFHQARLGDGRNETSKSLQMIMKDLGHE
ncbi:unnamed protein product, partial [Rotaria sordida]